MLKCDHCNKTDGRIIKSKKFKMTLCNACYNSFSQFGDKTYDLPKYGEVKVDKEGKFICHICGRAFKKVLNHVQQTHHLNKHQYKEKFGLYSTKGLCAESTKEKLRLSINNNYDLVVKQNLIEGGNKTRYYKYHEGRIKVVEQLRIALKTKFKKEI